MRYKKKKRICEIPSFAEKNLNNVMFVPINTLQIYIVKLTQRRVMK